MVVGKINSFCLCCSVTQSCPTLTPWTAACQASLFIANSRHLLKLMPIESVMPSNHLILCLPLLLLPSIFPSIRWPKYWSFISPSDEHPALISLRLDWLALLCCPCVVILWLTLSPMMTMKALVPSPGLSRPSPSEAGRGWTGRQ